MKSFSKSVKAVMAGALFFSFCSGAQAMQYSPVEKIGIFVEGPHPTIVQGQTETTANSVSFGSGAAAVKIDFSKDKNGKISRTTGVSVEGTKIKCAYLGNNIYRTMGDNGNPVYIAIGGPGVSQEFSLVAKHNGKNWHLLTIDILKEYIPRIDRLDYERAVYLLEPSAQGNVIKVPFGIIDETNRGYQLLGEFRFAWSDADGWFSVAKVDY